jgi:hypothetical protein
MPQDLSESVSGTVELVFPDDATGQYSLQKRSVYDAAEVRTELDSDVPQYGDWLPVEILDENREGWLIAPSRLRAELLDAEIRVGEVFQIETMTKTGNGQSDPYRVELNYPERDQSEQQQTGLSDV